MLGLDNFLIKLKKSDQKNNVPSVSFAVGNFLADTVQNLECQRVLEIGTAHGFSTLHLCKNLSKNGQITTYEISKPSFEAAKINFYRTHNETLITQRFINILECPELATEQPYDLIFIDGHKQKTLQFWHKVQAVTADQTIIIIDDVQKYRHKMNAFFDYLDRASQWTYRIIPLDEDDSICIAYKAHAHSPTKFAFLP